MSKIIKSISYAVIAQIVSLVVSAFMTFFVSRYMTVEYFGYYQLFLFYSTYVGIFQFGTSEGTYLENGGKDYIELDYSDLKALFLNVLLMQICVLLIVQFAVQSLEGNANKKVVIGLILIYALAHFFVMYYGMLLQAVNQTEKYSKAIIVGKTITLALFIMAVAVKDYRFETFCVIYLIGYCLTGGIVTFRCRRILFAHYTIKNSPFQIIKKHKSTFIAGCSLLFSTLISSLIIGINRIYIEYFLGIEEFGKFSMALSLCNLVILFAIQVGMVMFPNIVNLSVQEKTKIYKKLNTITSFLTPLFFLVYIPLEIFLNYWIPQYTESIHWMLIFVPYMIYETKNQVIFNTYLKAARQEKYMFSINLISFGLCAVINLFTIIWLKDLTVVLLIIDIVIIVKSILLSRRIDKTLNTSSIFMMCTEAIACAGSSLIMYCRIDFIGVLGMTILYIVFYAAQKMGKHKSTV